MQSLETYCAVRACPGGRTERGQDPVAAAGELLRQEQVFQGKEAPRPVTAGCSCLGEASGGEKWGCGQCPHFGSRTGPYSVCFGGSPVFAGAGTRFESLLGHSVSVGQEPFWCFFVWTVSTLSPLI